MIVLTVQKNTPTTKYLLPLLSGSQYCTAFSMLIKNENNESKLIGRRLMSPFTIDANNSASECCLGDQDNGPPNLIVPSLPSNDEPSSSIATSAANRPVGTNNSLTSDAECHKCLAFLARALDRAGSKPRFLLRALGVASRDEVGGLQSKEGDNTVKNAWYKPTEDGKGFVINLRRHGVVDDVTSNLPSADKITRSIDEGVQKLRGSSPENPAFEKGHSEEPTESEVSSVVSGKKIDDTNNITSNEMQQNHANNAHNSAISLRKKLTNAASLLVGGNKLREPVLTTSPSMHSHNPSENPYTTVTIECQTCGTETRAEAGGVYFFKLASNIFVIGHLHLTFRFPVVDLTANFRCISTCFCSRPCTSQHCSVF